MEYEIMRVGELKYQGIKYHFSIDDDLLYLDAMEDGGFSAWDALLSDMDLRLKEEYLIGECYPDMHSIIVLPVSPSFSYRNDTMIIRVRLIFEFRNAICPIAGLNFCGDEIDYIYDMSRCIDNHSFYPTGESKVTIKPFEETTVNEGIFTYQEKEIHCSFNINRSLYMGITSTPLTIYSNMLFTFDDSNDYDFLIKLYHYARRFISFLCYRSNIAFSQVKLKKKDCEGKYGECGDLIAFRSNEYQEDHKIISKRYIPYSLLAGHVKSILQDIVDGKLYTEHLPTSYKDGRKITPARFVMITAAFDWEFRRRYPDGIVRSESSVQAQNEVEMHIQSCIESSTGKKKDIYKFLKRLIRNDAMKEKVKLVGKDLSPIIEIFGKSLYERNGQTLNYEDMGQRVFDQRNNYAHGNIDKEFISLSLLDVVFLEQILYAMQLSHYQLDDLSIKKAINELFSCNFAL